MKLTTARSSVSVPKPAAAPQSATSSAARTLNPCLGKTQAPQRAAATGRQREWERERETTRRGKELEGSQWPTDYFWHRIKNETSIAQKLRHIAQARELFSAASAASVTVTVTVTGSATASSCSPSLPSPPPSTRPQPPDKVGLVLRGLMPASR